MTYWHRRADLKEQTETSLHLPLVTETVEDIKTCGGYRGGEPTSRVRPNSREDTVARSEMTLPTISIEPHYHAAPVWGRSCITTPIPTAVSTRHKRVCVSSPPPWGTRPAYRLHCPFATDFPRMRDPAIVQYLRGIAPIFLSGWGNLLVLPNTLLLTRGLMHHRMTGGDLPAPPLLYYHCRDTIEPQTSALNNGVPTIYNWCHLMVLYPLTLSTDANDY